MKYGRGYIRAPESHRAALPRKLGWGSRAPATSLRQFEAPCFDQGSTSACTGHALAMAIYVSLAAQGTPLPFVPSPLGIYTLARCIERVDPRVALGDTGATLGSAILGISQWGIHRIGPSVDGRNSDAGPSNVLVEPTLLDLEADAVNVIVGCQAIDPRDILGARAVLAQKSPIFVGGYVDTAYENYEVGASDVGVPNEADPNGGGHAMVIVGSFDNADGSTSFDDLTSWGASFGGDGGHVRVSERWLASMWDAFKVTARIA